MLVGFWFGVIAVLWSGFFLFEGFEFGVGMLAPLLRSESQRDTALRSIRPVWDGNEVWLVLAGGATSAAFPKWYGTAFSGFYVAFAMLLVGLVLRGIGIEYRGKASTSRGRRWCEAAVGIGSLVPAILFGVAFADLVRGVELDGNHVVTGGVFDLLSPFAVLGGLTTLALFLLHGALFLAFRTQGPTSARARALTRPLGWTTGVLASAFLIWSPQVRGKLFSEILAVLIIVAIVAAIRFAHAHRFALAFTAVSGAAVLFPIWTFASLWPYVLPARNGAQYSLTMHAAAASSHTLMVMTVVAVVITPLVAAYQAWTYWVFRARVGAPVQPSGTSKAADRVRSAALRASESS